MMATLQQTLALLGEWPRTDLPAALFPVRLETRFVPMGGGEVEFRLRIFPDDIHIDTFEPGLTADEIEAGRLYWQALWTGEQDAAQRDIAWRRLVDRFDAPRAAWIVRATTPKNVRRLGRGSPRFPRLKEQDDTWSLAAQVRLMPDRWAVCGYRSDKRILLETGAPIPAELAASPAPDTAEAPDPGDPPDDQSDLPLDDGMKWLVDFDEAVAKGMAIRTTLSTRDADKGFDRLIVLGLSDDPAGSDTLSNLLDAQHYTDGLGFLPQGTPTNNTSAGGNASDAMLDGEQIFNVTTGAPLVAKGDGSNGDVTAHALGLGTAPFSGVPLADDRERAEAEAMNTAMWQAGWGTYLREMVTAGDQHSYHGDIRTHFETFVHARGPLPTLKVGEQPYGILPILPFDRWTAGEDDAVEVALHPVLTKMRAQWVTEIERVPRVGRFEVPEHARDDFLRALSSDAVSIGYRARLLLAANLFGIPGVPGFNFDFPAGTAQRWNEAQSVGNDLGLSSIRRFGRLIPTGHDFALAGPLVQGDLIADALAPNYLEWLAETEWQSIFDENFTTLGEDFEPRALLYLTLRYALLVEYAYAAGRIRIAEGDLTEIDVHEPDIHDPGGTVTRPTRAMLTDTRVPSLGDGILRDFIHTLDASNSTELEPVDRMRASLRTLSKLPPARLDRLFRESVDLCSHRLDAWISSFAVRRLDKMRATKPAGIVLGGYGWLEDVRMERTHEPTEVPPGEDGPLFVDTENAGFVAAPSMTQAAAAAVLRNGWLSQPDAGNPLAIDLSSRRVRLARWLLDGVRQGQPLAALLGYRFERTLQDRGLARYVAPFRRISPYGAILAAENEVARLEVELTSLPSGSPELELVEEQLADARTHHDALLQQRREKFLFSEDASIEAMEALEENSVVDGLALREMWIAGAVPFGQSDLPDEAGADRAAVETVLEELDDAVDAVADAVLGESVYQTVAGNPQKVGATLAAVAAGEAPPPELEFARTPRSGFGVEHRLMILFSGATPGAPDWPGSATRPRALAEPLLERWAARLLGDPARVRLVTEWRVPETSEAVTQHEMRLSDLPLSALDLVHLVRGQEVPESTTLAEWVLHGMARSRPQGLPEGAMPHLVVDRASGFDSTDLSLAEISELARALHAVVSDARPIGPGDLAAPDSTGTAQIDLVEIEGRADAAAAALKADKETLQARLVDATTEPNALMDQMLAHLSYAIDTAIPDNATGDVDALKPQASAVIASAEERLAEQAALAASLSTEATPEQRLETAVARIQAIFGTDFSALPRIVVPDAAQLSQSFAASNALQDGDPTAAHTWMRRAARVREPVERLETLFDYTDGLRNLDGDRQGNTLSVAQLPHKPGDRWLGLPLGPEGTRDTSAVSVVAHLAAPLQTDAPIAGLVVDAWVDVIAAPRQHAALSFNFDAPGSRPPQAILLAVPPGNEERWQFETIEATVREALDLAKLRAVDPSLLQRLDGYDQFMPATVFALNLDDGDSPGGVTISADLMRAAETHETGSEL